MKKHTTPLLILFLLLSKVAAFAEDIADPFNGGDPGIISPINDYIIPMILVVLVFGYRVLNYKKKEYNEQLLNRTINQ